MKNIARGTVAAAAVIAVTTTLGLGAQPLAAATSSSERIVYSSPTEDGARVFSVSPDGSDPSEITVDGTLETFNRTVWSHDGSRLLYSNVLVFDVDGNLVAFRPAISAPDGSGFHVLTLPDLPPGMYCSAWSPDDTRIVCGEDGGTLISVRASDGGGLVTLTENPYGGQDLAVGFSPTDGRLAFLRSRPGPDRPNRGNDQAQRIALFVAHEDGSDAHRITEWGKLLPHELAGANWSPDGRSLISTNRHGTLVEVAADGSHVTPIHLSLADTGSTFAVTPDYSPDGSQIVFALFQRSEADLYVADRDGSSAHPITRTADSSEWFPDWS